MDGASRSEAPDVAARAVAAGDLLGKVFVLVAFSLVFTLGGGYLGRVAGLGGPGLFLANVIALGCALALGRVREVPVVNLGVLYSLAFCLGLALGPTIDLYVRAGLSAAVYQAVGMTVALTLGLSVYALTTQRDFARLEDYLYFALLGLIVAWAASWALGLTLGQAVVSLLVPVVFCVFVVVDVQKARRMEDTIGNAVVLAADVYLDVLNLCLYLLRLLASASSDD